MRYELSENVHYVDYEKDPIFYHPKLNRIAVWAQFKVLIPEYYGWIVVGYL